MSRASKGPKPPSIVEVTLGAVISLVIGATLAAGYLIAQPVETVRVMPKEPDPDKVYYQAGSARSSLGGQWLRKKQMLIEGGAVEIQLTEDELNTWMASSTAKPDAEAETGAFVAKNINFRVRDGVMQIGLPCSIKLPGFTKDVIVQAKGDFKVQGTTHVFVPESVMVGTLAVDKLPVVGDFILDRLRASQEYPEELTKAWSTLSEVAVEDNFLKLARR
ncbi:hypothetical protein [Synoicihabitans lomoniglobus]|uniref:Uncharacterized protein n=1 Tax=Synoicihabitans lomoniglobus TaxID=2909285 RepID=A0AAF0I387_9BACT|nr:hypothetical protein [Opitutaceae bacterium LMO-M01]WED66193.1 hypothetical protein PXH66_04950 [Opitutaceae bacterium LMO-M01]